MLRGIDPLLGPDLLFVLRAMGHGDEIAVVDANYPATDGAKRLIRAEGTDAVRMVEESSPSCRHLRRHGGVAHGGRR